jgi:hypothetical protein
MKLSLDVYLESNDLLPWWQLSGGSFKILNEYRPDILYFADHVSLSFLNEVAQVLTANTPNVVMRHKRNGE